LDNVTHAIAGAITAEVVIQLRRRTLRGAAAPADPAFEPAAWAVSMIAHNLPDADSLYTRITGGVLGYLLHHRGHTHTLALAPLIALLSYGLVVGWARLRGNALGRGDRGCLALLALLGPVGHIVLDASNEYGVHPFWPFDDGWIYGDTIFIVEPLFWCCSIPVLFAATVWRTGRVLWGALLAFVLGLAWLISLVPWYSALAATLIALASAVVARRASPMARAAFALGGSLALVALFAACSATANTNVRAALARSHAEWDTLDVSRSPLPATPLCWHTVVVQRSRDGERYALRTAEVSAWPAVVSAGACARTTTMTTTAPLHPGDLRERDVIVTGQLEAPLGELRERAKRCDASAYLRWSRAPFFAPSSEGFVAGDLRYDRSPDLEFAELQMPRDIAQCPRFVPPWPPRADLLER
jgi:inner membrane protein